VGLVFPTGWWRAPRQGSSTRGWHGRPWGGLPCWICRPSSPPWRWWRWCIALPDQSLSKLPWMCSGVATRCVDDVNAIRFTLVLFYFCTYILIKPFMYSFLYHMRVACALPLLSDMLVITFQEMLIMSTDFHKYLK
jgi:hypothetical protein